MDLIRYLNTVSNNEGMSNYTIIEILKKFCAEIDQNMISSIHVNNVTPSTAKFQIVLKNGTIYQSEAITLPQGEKGDKGDKGDTGLTPDITILVTGLPAGSDPTVTKSGTVDNPIYTLGIPEGEKGDTGNGIESIIKTDTSGLVDTYTITFTNGNTKTFTVTNGEDGTDGTNGQDGNGIVSISKTGTSGLIDTYTITFTNGTTSTFTVTNGATGATGATGNGISAITKTGTSGLIDTYTITFTNGSTSTFTVTNGSDLATVLSNDVNYWELDVGWYQISASLKIYYDSSHYINAVSGNYLCISNKDSTWCDAFFYGDAVIYSLQHNLPTNTGSQRNVAFTDEIPTVNQGVLTIQKNGVKIAQFNANNLNNVTANIICEDVAEYGTNYVRFDKSGIQICWGRNTWNSRNNGTGSFSFPKSFLSGTIPSIVATASSPNSGGSASSPATIYSGNMSNTGFGYTVYGVGGGDRNNGITYMAIGKWK